MRLEVYLANDLLGTENEDTELASLHTRDDPSFCVWVIVKIQLPLNELEKLWEVQVW